jgi:vacuolar-type H+-ATPase subunit E/Vma4
MGKEELVRHLIGIAESRKEEILRNAREEAGRRIANALAQAARMEAECADAIGRETALERDRRMSRARLEACFLELRARDLIAEKIMARLEKRLSQAPRAAGYPSSARRLFLEILPELPAGNILLAADPAALESIAALASEPRIRLVPLPAGEWGGVEASHESGSIRIRNTLKARLENARPALLAEIRRSLDGGDE